MSSDPPNRLRAPRRTLGFVAAGVFLVVAVAGFGLTELRNMFPANQVTLAGSTWRLTETNDSPVPREAIETIAFREDGSVAVTSACESFAAKWDFDASDDALAIFDIPPRVANCSAAAQEYDSELRRSLDGVRRWSVDSQDQIRFGGADHLILQRVAGGS